MSLRTRVKDAELTRAEIGFAKGLIVRALKPRFLPVYSTEERLVLAILTANLSLRLSTAGKKGGSARVTKTNYRKAHVNILLRYVIPKRYRDNNNANSLATRMKIIEWLEKIGIEASVSQVWRDIRAALKLGLPTQ